MYINDVIKQVHNFYPSEYTINEMYLWCNEVNAMLTVTERQTIQEVNLPIGRDGRVFLPEDVEFENIVAVYCGNVLLDKTLLQYHARDLVHIKGLNSFYISGDYGARDNSVAVIYEAPYSPIRIVAYRGEVTISDKAEGPDSRIDYWTIEIASEKFLPGDTILLDVDGQVISDIPVFAVDFNSENGNHILTVANKGFDALPRHFFVDGIVERHVTDKTICQAPFDTMYVHYIMAKIAYFQHDKAGYETYTNEFNNLLAQYKKWLLPRLPKANGTFNRWW